MSTILQILASPRRRAILRLVWEEERSAGAIHHALDDVTFGAISQHLRVLTEAELLDVRQDGRHRWYRARKNRLGTLKTWLENSWSDALQILAEKVEMEAARRGPRKIARRTRSAQRSRKQRTP